MRTEAPNTICVCGKICVCIFFAAGLKDWIKASSAFEIFSDVVFKGRCTVQSAAASQVCRAQWDSVRGTASSVPLWLFHLIDACVCGRVYVCLFVRALACICWNDWWQKSSLLNVLLTVTQWELHNHHNQLMCFCVGWFQGQHKYVQSKPLTVCYGDWSTR